ncbi:LysR substrate-binding domain-containing protein [Rhizobium leguminosarum]|uniref:LysR substrate-binding domain-containing protein n=1 Tax=Rhizobium leguminosarum TaxID=384 RepID=UPI003D15D73D
MFADGGGPLTGRLRLEVPSALAQPAFIGRLFEFATNFPGIEIVLGVSDRNVDLLAEGVDCVVRIGDLKDSSLISPDWYGKDGNVRVALISGFLREPRNLSDLPRHRSVTFISGRSRRPLLWHFQENGQSITLHPDSGILVNAAHAYVSCGLAGFGLIQAPGSSLLASFPTGSAGGPCRLPPDAAPGFGTVPK